MDNSLQNLQKIGDFMVAPFNGTLDGSNFVSLPVDIALKPQITSLMHVLPYMGLTAASTGLYTVSFPEGLPHTLTKLKDGGYSTALKSQDSGKFIGSASLHEVEGVTSALQVFTAMSLVTGQYFLSEIHNDLRVINQKMDRILEFLYGDKKAELLSEIDFIRYAHANFTSIMQHSEQRSATIFSLQSTRKVAIKDIEFYIRDLGASVNAEIKSERELRSYSDKAFQLYDSLNLSLQLYAVSSLLEAYYAQNTDACYLSGLEEGIFSYIDKCDKRALSYFSVMLAKTENMKAALPLMKGPDKSRLIQAINAKLDRLHERPTSEQYTCIRDALHSIREPIEFVANSEGSLWCKKRSA